MDISDMPIRIMLEQYTLAKAEMELIDIELQQYHVVTDSVKGSMTEYPYTTHSIPIQGVAPDVKELLQARKAKLARLRLDVERFLAGVNDSYIASLIRLRYLQGMEWEQVADQMNKDGGKYTSSGIRASVHRYLKSCNTCNTRGCYNISG